MNITADIFPVGVSDRNIDLFEGQYRVPNGMAYNSYLILDEKTAILDTVGEGFGEAWISNIRAVLGDRAPDYLIIQHMEPDHSANILTFLAAYPSAALVGNAKTFGMLGQFFREDFPTPARLTVENKGTLSLGRHTLRFLFAPMVHWPEVMVTFDETDHVLFSADAFGKFGAADCKEPWDAEARRYYFGIVGKYGRPVSVLLNAAAGLPIEKICSLHGPVLEGDLTPYISLYRKWAAYEPESEGVLIAYTSVYGHTRAAAELLGEELKKRCCPEVVLCDLAREDWSFAVAEAFRLGRLVLATTTYNGGMFPSMREFLTHLTERGFGHRTVGLIENGSWAPTAGALMKEALACAPEIDWLETSVTIRSSLSDENRTELVRMAEELTAEGGCKVEPRDAAVPDRRWVCDVCGYVYEGDSLPEGFTCPLCRVDASHFKVEEPAAPATPARRWVCDVCGYVYEGDSLPEGFTCPLCRVDASHFKVEEPAAPAAPARRWVCDVCGYVYEGDSLPEGFTCPLCRVDASHFKEG